MSRIDPVDRNTSNTNVRKTFDAVERQLGFTPNMHRTMAQSPWVLDGYMAFAGALRRGFLSARLQEQIALAVAEANGCDYCLSAHSALGRKFGVPDEQLTASREAYSPDPKITAALQFARALIERRGGVTDLELARVRGAGYSDGEVAEIIANVALNVFTNYLNRTAQTEIDFPPVRAGEGMAGRAA